MKLFERVFQGSLRVAFVTTGEGRLLAPTPTADLLNTRVMEL